MSEAEDLGTQYRRLEDFKNPYVQSVIAGARGTNKLKETKTTRKGTEGQQERVELPSKRHLEANISFQSPEEGAPSNLGMPKTDGLKETLHTEKISSGRLLDRLIEFRKFEPQKPDVKVVGGNMAGGTKPSGGVVSPKPQVDPADF